MPDSMYTKDRLFRRRFRTMRELRTLRRAQIMRAASRMSATMLFLAIFFLMTLVCFRPWNELRVMERDKRNLEEQLEKRSESLEYTKKEFIWISDDPAYFEMIARDRNDLALPHEKVYRIERSHFVQ